MGRKEITWFIVIVIVIVAISIPAAMEMEQYLDRLLSALEAIANK